MSQYVEFQLAEEQKPKTKVWNVLSKSMGDLLGIIKWYGPWRQYVFFPETETIYSSGCMAFITDFINRANSEQRKAKILK
jgi:hypothetical protein